MVTIREVAQLAGVSVSTVSIVINGQAAKRKISEKTQEKVRQAISELDFQPSRSARMMRSSTNENPLIAIYWALDTRFGYIDQMMTGLQRGLIETGLNANFLICPYTPGQLGKETMLFSNYSFQAVIVANTLENDLEFIEDHRIKVPCVLFNRNSQTYHSVTIDNNGIGSCLAQTLKNRDVKTIGILGQQDFMTGMNARSRSFIQTAESLGMQINRDMVFNFRSSITNGYQAGEQLCAMADKNGMPDAFYCDTDDLAQGLIYAFQKNQVRVPEDIQVVAVGFRRLESNLYLNPSITLVQLPVEEVALECLFVLREALQQPNLTRINRIIHFHPIQGESTQLPVSEA